VIRRSLANLLGLLRIRLELAGLELQDEIDHAVRALAMGVAGALLVCAGAIFGAVALVVALWETHRVLALVGVAMLLSGAGLVVLLLMHRQSRDRAPIFSESVAQLEQDRRRMSGQ
jgi:uncharacterized membrane protein YqjE